MDDKYIPDLWVLIEAQEENRRSGWEMTRAICYNIHIHSMAKRKKPSPESFWGFPWDQGHRLSEKQLLAMEEFKRRKQLANGGQ